MDKLNCSYCLWLNSKKIYNASEIKDNFDLKSLRGYLLGGSLINWLKCNFGEDIAEYLNNVFIPESGNVDEILEYAFGIRKNPPAINNETVNSNLEYRFLNTDYNHSSFSQRFSSGMTSGIAGSYNIFGSYKTGSFLYFGSGYGSNNIGLWIFVKGSGFYYTGSRIYTAGSDNSLYLKSFVDYMNIPVEIISNIEKCPLNKYGYGIHLI